MGDRGELLRLHARPSAILLPLALPAVLPLVIYAVRQGNLPSIQHKVTYQYVDTYGDGSGITSKRGGADYT